MIMSVITFQIAKSSERYVKIKIGRKTIKAEVADTPAKMIVGLTKKKQMSFDEGMLFVLRKEGYPGFWMFNMSFPIDILWIDKNFRIVDITKDAKPCIINCKIYKPKEKVLYVLEVKSGFVDKYGVEEGTKIKILD